MTNEMPRRLPIIRHKGKDYFIDWRLREFRPVEPPLEFIPFDSELGREIDSMPEPERDTVMVTCPRCGTVLFEGTEEQRKRLIIYCANCCENRKS